MNHERAALIAAMTLLLGIYAGCSQGPLSGRAGSSAVLARSVSAEYASDEGGAPGMAYGESGVITPAPAFKAGSNLSGGAAETSATAPDRKLVKSAEIHIRADNLEEAGRAVMELAQSRGGYASSTTRLDNSLRYTLKIPSAHYETVLTGVSKLGKILYQSENTEDVTIRFYDLDGRLNTKRELLKTFQDYLEKAKSIEEIMSVEQRVAELQQEIDWLGSQLSSLSHLVDYATITLDIEGPSSASPYYKPDIKERIGKLLGSFGEYASGALLVLIGVVIYGVPALLILTLLLWVLFGKIGLLKKLWRLVIR